MSCGTRATMSKFCSTTKKDRGGDSPQGMEWGKLCGPYSSAHTSQREPGLRVIIRKTLSRMVELKGGKDDH